jgi:hypothetical protein
MIIAATQTNAVNHTFRQFHQRFSRAFFVPIFGANVKRNMAPKICMKNAREKC